MLEFFQHTNSDRTNPRNAARLSTRRMPMNESRVNLARRRLLYHPLFKLWLICAAGLALSEPILVAFPSDSSVAYAQFIVLIASTVLFVVGILFTAAAIDDSEEPTPAWLKIIETFNGEVLLELLLLCEGWIFILTSPGLAALRCFRVFRYLWYFEMMRIRRKNPIYLLYHAARLCVVYIKKLYIEIFTSGSKGALVVLGIYFYMSYILGVVFWLKTRGWVETRQCDTLVHCMWTMMRLTFYDEKGFDFVKVMFDVKYNALVALLILYMCITAMIFLNGLIGIFGDAFYIVFKEVGPDDDNKSQPDGDEDDEEVQRGVHYDTSASSAVTLDELRASNTSFEVMLTSIVAEKMRLKAELKALREQLKA